MKFTSGLVSILVTNASTFWRRDFYKVIIRYSLTTSGYEPYIGPI